ncbi:MAG: hypothetical protein WBC90_03310 [Albidovulum sp.]
MGNLVWIGALVTLGGLLGLIWCIISVARARKAGLSEEALKARLQRAVVLNLGAMFLSVIGLMIVVIGIFFG